MSVRLAEPATAVPYIVERGCGTESSLSIGPGACSRNRNFSCQGNRQRSRKDPGARRLPIPGNTASDHRNLPNPTVHRPPARCQNIHVLGADGAGSWRVPRNWTPFDRVSIAWVNGQLKRCYADSSTRSNARTCSVFRHPSSRACPAAAARRYRLRCPPHVRRIPSDWARFNALCSGRRRVDR